jgi:hypothetical protein
MGKGQSLAPLVLQQIGAYFLSRFGSRIAGFS